MHQESKSLLKQAVLNCLPALHTLVGKLVEPYRVYKKRSDGAWVGEVVNRPDLGQVFKEAHERLESEGKVFTTSFLKHHSDYNGHVVIPRFGGINFGKFIGSVFSAVIEHHWRKYGTFDVKDENVDLLVNEFEEFVDNPTIRLLFRAQLLNFKTPTDYISLPEGLRIRRMTENEVTEIYGGSLDTADMRGFRRVTIDEFCIEGETEERKVFGIPETFEWLNKDRVKDSLDKAIRSLRTFKKGQVGYDYIYFYPFTFCPFRPGSYGFGDRFVPFGNYNLNDEEKEDLARHANMVFCLSEQSMDLACSRLADAETRTKPEDRIIDAVIGMESLLLAGVSKEDRRGELKLRFSLNYSTLFKSSEERCIAFDTAKDLYDLRSIVVHGSKPGGKPYRFGDEKLNLADAADRASETLRHLVKHFLPMAQEAPYRDPAFWKRAYFFLPDTEKA